MQEARVVLAPASGPVLRESKEVSRASLASPTEAASRLRVDSTAFDRSQMGPLAEHRVPTMRLKPAPTADPLADFAAEAC